MRTARSYLEYFTRIRGTDASGDRVAGEIAGADFVQPTVQLEAVGHLTVPHTVPVAFGGSAGVADAVRRSTLALAPALGSAGLLVRWCGFRNTDWQLRLIDGTTALAAMQTFGLVLVPECVSEGPATANLAHGGIASLGNSGPFLFPADSFPDLGLFVRPGRVFLIWVNANNTPGWGGISWQEYPAQQRPQA